MGRPAIDIEHLSRDERLDLIEELWESLSEAERTAMPLTREQEEEVDRRLEMSSRDGNFGITPEELRARLKQRSS